MNFTVEIENVPGDGLIRYVGAAIGDSAGTALATGPDADKDGAPDLLIGTYKSTPTTPVSEGVAYLLFSGPVSVETATTTSLGGMAASDGVKFDVVGLPQVNALFFSSKVAAGVAPPNINYGADYILLQHYSLQRSATTSAFFPGAVADITSLGVVDVGTYSLTPDSFRTTEANGGLPSSVTGKTYLRTYDTAGDFDGDGVTDIAARDFAIKGVTPGDILLVSGTQLLNDTEPQDLFDAADYGGGAAVVLDIDNGLELYANGLFVKNAGDVTGDGADDLIFAVAPTGTSTYEIVIVSGAALFADADGFVALSDLSFPDIIRIKPPSTYSAYLKYDTGGDFDGDHATDVLLSSLSIHDSQTGSIGGAYVLYSSGLLADDDGVIDLTTLDASVGALILKGRPASDFGDVGHAFAIGDIDGGGSDDILIASQAQGVGSVSHAYIVRGEALAGLGAAPFRLDGSLIGKGLKISAPPLSKTTILDRNLFADVVARALDTDGDSIADLAIGVPGDGVTSGSNILTDAAGAVYVIPSSRINAAINYNGELDLGEEF